jgi:chromosome segregation protein
VSFFIEVYDIIFFNMYLKRLEILGFKSFAKKGSLEFNSPISAIVGPNGSGKSNVAESIRFVLGEQSMKSLRGKRGEDLIWNGSGNTPRSNHASVTIVFDNTKKEFDIDYDEVSVKREVYRDGVNQYFINNSQVRLKDIFELLAKVHIGATGHHIISQGEADRVLNANIKERRTMIEDALGLKIYKWKIEESEKKLLKTDDNIKQVHSLRREITPHIKFLKKQVEKIEKVKEMRNELHALYADYLKREYEYIKYEKERVSKEKKAPTEELKLIDSKLAKAREILSVSDNTDPKKDELINIEKQIEIIRNKKDELSRKIGRLEGMIEFEDRRIKKVNIENSKKKVVPYDTVKNFTDGLEKYLNSTDGKSIEIVNNIFNEIRSAIKRFTLSITENTQEEGSISQDEMKELIKERDDVNTSLVEVIKDEQNLDTKYKKIKFEIESDKDSSRETEREMFEMMSNRNNLLSKLNTIANSEEKIERDERMLKEEMKEGAALIGRGITEYEKIEIPVEDIVNEDRELQDSRRKKIEKIKIKLEVEGVGGAEDIMKEYKETVERDAFLEKELEDLDKSRGSLRVLISDLTEKLDSDFKNGIQKINSQFQEFFSVMFGGGSASLSVVSQKRKKRKGVDILPSDNDDGMLEDISEEEKEEGIDVSISLPRKKIRGLQMLSGGERALTSIALIFAVSQVNPPPFLVLDETDAALDEANSRKYGDIIESLSKHSQLIVITHNRETMARANILYGITMGSDAASKLLSVRFDEATVYAK